MLINQDKTLTISVERAMGIEPTSKAWEAFVLPLNYARLHCQYYASSPLSLNRRGPVGGVITMSSGGNCQTSMNAMPVTVSDFDV